MANTIYAGYRGLANIEGVGQVRFSDAGIAARQEVNAPDLVMGDWDRDAYNYGPVEITGSIAGPVTETFITGSGGGVGLWNWGVRREAPCGELSSGDVDLYYYCGDDGGGGNHVRFDGVYVNSLNFSCAAGDVAQFSIDVMGRRAGAFDDETPPHFIDAEKLLTWDKVQLTFTSGQPEFTAPIAYSNFDITISNNLEAAYSLGEDDLFPFQIVPGIRSISGSVTAYNVPLAEGVNSWDDYLANEVGTLGFNIGGLEKTVNVRWHRVEPASTTGLLTSTIAFTGVTHQTSLDE